MENSKDFNLESDMEAQIQKLIEGIKNNPDFVFVKNLIDKKPEAEVYLVGGAVRDALLGKEIKDYDFVVTGIEKKELEEFLKNYGEVKDVDSRSFGVFKFVPKGYQGEPIDVALPRKERQTGLGYKDFKIESSAKLGIDDDLARRDLTINAIAINLKNGLLVDKFGGLKDIKEGIIRAVGNPEERFAEDPSRILRAIRLACQMSFQIEPKTLESAKKLASEITKNFKDKENHEKSRVASETVAAEFLKGLVKDPVRLIELYDQTGVLAQILPELSVLKGVEQPAQFHSEGDVWEHTILTLKNLKPDADINLKLAALFHDIGKPLTQKTPEKHGTDRIRFHEHASEGADIFKRIFDRLKLSAPFAKNNSSFYADRKKIIWLIKNHMICTGTKPEQMRSGTIEKYFFGKRGERTKRGKHLLELSKADISATILPTGESDFTALNNLGKRINEVEDILKKQAGKEKLAKKIPLILDGHSVQKVFKIKPGPAVGRIKDLIRYLQLEGELKTVDDVREKKSLIQKSAQENKKTEKSVKRYFELKEQEE